MTETTTTMKEYNLPRTRGRAVKFTGEEIAEISDKYVNGRENTRWTNLTLYRTKAGKYILQRESITQWQGEENNDEVTVCHNVTSVLAVLARKADGGSQVAMEDDQLPLDEFPDEELGRLETDLLQRARKHDPAFGKAAVEEVE